ncbi:hypothetical protein ABKV19_016079 [Rosa sericea]
MNFNHQKEAEEHLPYIHNKEGVWMHMDDMDYHQVWTIKFRFWNNNNSGRIYIFENTREFVTRHGLDVGDSIEVFKDIMSGSFIIRATNTLGAPGLIHEQCLSRSKENDEYLFLNQVYSAKNASEQVVQDSSDLPNLLALGNNDVLLNQDQVIIINNEELQPAQPAQPAQPTQDYGGLQEQNTIDNLLNECFPTLDDFDLYDTTGMVDQMGQPFDNNSQHLQRSQSTETIIVSLWD